MMMDDGGASAFKVYYVIRSFITFNGIFMAHGYDLGSDNIWRNESNIVFNTYRKDVTWVVY